MRTVLLSLLAVSLVAAAPVVTTDDDDPVSEPCLAQTGLDFILTNEGLTEAIPTPLLPSPYPLGLGGEPDPAGFQDAATEVYTVLLDVSPDYIAAEPSVTVTWEHTGDIDVDAYVDGQLVDGSHNFNPLDGNTETLNEIGLLGHCETFDLHVRNYVATQGDITVEMDVLNGIAPPQAAS